MLPSVEEYLRAIPGAAVVVDSRGRPLHTMLPADPKPHEETAFYWLQQHGDEVQAWVSSLGAGFPSHELIVVDEESTWMYALKLLKRAEWPEQTSPRNCELMLMSWAWWTKCVVAKGRRLDEHYAGLLSRLMVPGVADGAGDRVFDDERARKAILAMPAIGRAVSMLDAAFDMDPMIRGWAKRWADSGFCKVEIAPKTAAALIISDAPRDVLSPWKAFSIVVPPGLCDPVRRLWCAGADDTGHVGLLSAVEENGHAVGTDPQLPSSGIWCTKERHEMLTNLVCGAVIAIENGSAEQLKRRGPPREDKPDAAPEFAYWRVAAPIRIDFREEVAAQWRGGTADRRRIRAQFPVRGHYRNQACGPKLAERKRIWVHPFWKGDRSAVALLRRVEIDSMRNESTQQS